MDKDFDALGLFSLYLAILNLQENREQSAHNDVSAANDQQAKYLLAELSRKFEEQNEILKRILTLLEDAEYERNQRNGKADP